ncbi:uncharacterized protein LOC112602391 [Melanaphis sacchari]|uniref:uncharacterized protein LOC112602391 n=1 Tax=Melanaphis sacchari TaxID=742174 RepID=UPI000DC13F6E|nr:uncharacterized protein LOC112602391 [Melanaphis sacchari]
MGKPQYIQKFRQVWKKDKLFMDWLQEVKDDPTKAYCKVCCCTIRARKADLVTHSDCNKHKSALGATCIKRTGSFQFKPNNFKMQHAQASMALFVSAHSAIIAIDHLSELCNTNFTGDNIKMHRTKCSSIIINILAPFFINNLREDIGTSKYSLLIDESTDISVLKFLGMAIIYYSRDKNDIVTTFFALEQLGECNAQAIVDAMKSALQKYNLDIKNLIGIGSDNASVMVGINKGVYAILKQENPNLILIRCVCHSLQLATSQACAETVPRHLDFLISESYNWFSKSTLRQQSYKDLYKCMNENHEPLKIVQACNTRWLSIETAVVRIIDQWNELKLHFEISRSKEKCYSAEMLYTLYRDEHNLAYLLFLRPLLGEIQRVNKLFESEYADPTKLGSELISLITFLGKIIVVPSFNFTKSTNFTDHLNPKPYLGYGFENKVEDLKKKGKLSSDQEQVLRSRCISFIIYIVKQLQQRLPENIQILKKIEVFSPRNALKQLKEPISLICEHFGIENKIIEKIDLQWRNIVFQKWEKTKSAVEFWSEVNNFTDAGGNNPFEDLAALVLTILSLPWSNAACERIFSQMNIVKSKSRNRMKSPMLISLLHIRSGLKRNKKCCHNFKFPDSIVKSIGTMNVYNCNVENEISEITEILDDLPAFM